MPAVPEYTATQAIEPSNVAEAAALQRGRRAGVLGNEQATDIRQSYGDIAKGLNTLGEVVDKHARQQASIKLYDASANALSDLDQSLRQHLRDAGPFNPNAAKEWREQTLSPYLQDMRQRFSDAPAEVQVQVAETTDRLATDFYKHSVAEESSRQGAVARTAIEQATNTLSNVAGRPGGIPLALGQAERQIRDIILHTPGLSPEDQQKYSTEVVQKIKEHVIESGLRAAIDRDPQNGFATNWSPEYTNILSQAKVSQLQEHSVQRQHLQLSTQNLTETMADRAAKLDFNQNLSQIYNESAQLTPNGILLKPDFLNRMQDLIDKHPGAKFEPNTLKAGMDWAKAIQEEHNTGKLDTTDPTTHTQLNNRLLDERNPLTTFDLDKMKIDHKISDNDWMTYRHAVDDQEKLAAENPQIRSMVSQSLQAGRDYINPKGILGAALDLTGQQGLRVANWERWAIPTYLSMVRGGMKPQDALARITDQKELDRYKNASPVEGAIQAVPAPTTIPNNSASDAYKFMWGTK